MSTRLPRPQRNCGIYSGSTFNAALCGTLKNLANNCDLKNQRMKVLSPFKEIVLNNAVTILFSSSSMEEIQKPLCIYSYS
ncbi:hypothetical protein TNIN_75331 [Trichonephila inaurata madagascariensis]|uniref:Uncharacterized protein n=1 Tax=Trichonephila inaurata madagascariensis TaxID=2747483 RepID=A0A8X6WZ59_9ARAC|nr:hypothetical protein TNIN_75331 [Trichonephila inaurata madagascariensis]